MIEIVNCVIVAFPFTNKKSGTSFMKDVLQIMPFHIWKVKELQII